MQKSKQVVTHRNIMAILVACSWLSSFRLLYFPVPYHTKLVCLHALLASEYLTLTISIFYKMLWWFNDVGICLPANRLRWTRQHRSLNSWWQISGVTLSSYANMEQESHFIVFSLVMLRTTALLTIISII